MLGRRCVVSQGAELDFIYIHYYIVEATNHVLATEALYIVSFVQWADVLSIFRCYSDGTLNPSGVRFGSAEIYNIGECHNCAATTDDKLTNFVPIFCCEIDQASLSLSLSVEHVEGVADSLCVAQSYRSDERVILFLKMESGHK